jgi:hypothetical protein
MLRWVEMPKRACTINSIFRRSTVYRRTQIPVVVTNRNYPLLKEFVLEGVRRAMAIISYLPIFKRSQSRCRRVKNDMTELTLSHYPCGGQISTKERETTMFL